MPRLAIIVEDDEEFTELYRDIGSIKRLIERGVISTEDGDPLPELREKLVDQISAVEGP